MKVFSLKYRTETSLRRIQISPRLFNREAVDSQHPPQCILGAVDDVLLLLVIQLLLDDVLTQVEHHLQGDTHHRCIMGEMQSAADAASRYTTAERSIKMNRKHETFT